MFCSKCGIAVLGTQNFCTSCGFSLKSGSDAANGQRGVIDLDEKTLDELSRRISEVEAKLPKTRVLNKKFWPRALAVYGHSIAGGLPLLIFILIVATIAIPSLLRTRPAAHEPAAVTMLRTIVTAEVTYLSISNGRFGNISDLIGSGLIAPNFIPGPVSGYNFSIVLDATNSDFTVTAVPASANDGRYGYFVTPDGVIRYSLETHLAPYGSVGTPVTQ